MTSINQKRKEFVIIVEYAGVVTHLLFVYLKNTFVNKIKSCINLTDKVYQTTINQKFKIANRRRENLTEKIYTVEEI